MSTPAPAAFETHFSMQEQQALQHLQQAKDTLEYHRHHNEFVRSIMSTCEANGLLYVDQLRVLCANLLNQHMQASEVLLRMDQQIKEQQLALSQAAPVTRKVIQHWQNNNTGKQFALCDDGTVWKLTPKPNERPVWSEELTLSAPIPQGPVL